MERLRITEIFLSLQGESRSVGWPTVFVRLTGCPARCVYCDTAYAFHGGAWWALPDILQQVASHGVRHVTVTGGEPLAQKACLPLLTAFCNASYDVSLETGGMLDIAPVDPRVIKVVDIKTPGSGEAQRNHWSNIDQLRPQDQVKFVICSEQDYHWAVTTVKDRALNQRCEVLFSPSSGGLEARQLADWIVRDRLPVRFQIQLHKYLWGNKAGH
ncbi:MAG TPA: 7-carboxy-7-deazaguanine synthase QueE [Gammaproteobacteria bacterium]|nr:7-carboxy-7-deazaguanine synthase QueE [Gammaproteobacteria bacterium]